jgi:aspartate-semialdehyde dehydrogenase
MSDFIVVAGATGVVGRQLVSLLVDQKVDADRVRLLASNRHEGDEIDFGDETLPIEKLEADSFRKAQAVLLATPVEVAKNLAAAAQLEGAWAIDASGSHRNNVKIPLWCPGFNDGDLTKGFEGRVISVAHPATQAMLALTKILGQGNTVRFLDATLLCGASVFGQKGLEQLHQQTVELLNAKDPDIELFAHRLAFNAIPQVGEFVGDTTQFEQGLSDELTRLMPQGATSFGLTGILVPTYHGVLVSLTAVLERGIEAAELRERFKAAAGFKVLDDVGQKIYPMPMLTAHDTSFHVGRVRCQGTKIQMVLSFDAGLAMAQSCMAAFKTLTAA